MPQTFFTQDRVAHVAIAFIALFLFIWMWAIPPFQNPDEGAHYIKTCANPIVQTHPERGYGHYFNHAMVEVNDLAKVQPIRRGEDKFSFKDYFSEPIYKSEDWVFYRHAVPNTLVPYIIPAATCKTLDRFQITYQALFYILKATFVFSFLILIYMCKLYDTRLFLALAPFFMIPMVINQGAAISADYFSIAATAIFGIAVGLASTGKSISPLKLGFAAFLLLNSKIVYAPLIGALILPLIIHRKIFFNFKHISSLVLFSTTALVLQYYYQTRKTPMPHIHERTLEQLSRLQQEPGSVLNMFAQTLNEYYNFYLTSFFGTAGWLTTPIHQNLMIAGIFIIIAWIAFGLFSKSKFTPKWILMLSSSILTLIVSFSLIFLSMYFYWTHPERALIEGVQGRYLLPLLFFITPIIFSARNNSKIHVQFIPAFILMSIITTAFLLQSVLPFFHGLNLL
jgi:uncharacterized membrane protein